MIGFLFFLAGLIGTMVATMGYWWDDKNEGVRGVKLAVAGVCALFVGLFFGTIGGAAQVIPAGHRAVVFDSFSGVKPKALGEGINFVMPFVQDVIKYDIRVQKVEFEATAASKDLQDVATKVAINFHPDPESVPELYRQYGVAYQEKVIHPAVQEVVKAVTALYTAEELITKREQVKAGMQEHLARLMQIAKLHLDETYITDFKFSEGFSHAIEAKQVAEQNALKARRDLDRIRLEAEQKIAGLRAEAEGLRMQKEQITPMMIKLRMVEKWDGHYPIVVGGNGMIPMLKMDDLKAVARAGGEDDDK